MRGTGRARTTGPAAHLIRRTIQHPWNGWDGAKYRIADLQRPHWSSVSGGVGRSANRAYVHGYVLCDQALEGELAHSCLHGEGPHRVKVCVVAKDNDKKVMDQLKERATENDRRRFGGR